MARVKNGVVHHKRVKKVLKAVKGFRTKRRNLYRVAKGSLMTSLYNAYKGRKLKKRNFRRLWISRISAATKQLGIRYSLFISKLHKLNIKLDRKILSNIAMEDSDSFKKIIHQI